MKKAFIPSCWPGLLPVLVLSFSLTKIASVTIFLPVPFVFLLFCCLVSLAFFELVSLNKYTLFFVPLAIVVSAGLIWLMLTAEAREAVVAFVQWCIAFFSENPPYLPAYPYLLGAGLAAGITLFCWFFGRKVFFFPVLMAFSCVITLNAWIYNHHDIFVFALAIMLVLMLYFAAGSHKGSAGKDDRKRNSTLWMLSIAPYGVLVILLTLFFVAGNSHLWRNENVVQKLDRLNDYVSDYGIISGSGYRSSFSISQAGFTPLGDRLGGPVQLKGVEYFKVYGNRPILLRGSVYDQYTGQNWESSLPDQHYRFSQSVNEAEQTATFDLDRPAQLLSQEQTYATLISSGTYDVEMMDDDLSNIFVPYRGVKDIEPAGFLSFVPFFNTKGEAFSLHNLPKNTRYTVTYTYLNYEHPEFDGFMENATFGAQDYRTLSSEEQQAYTQLPDTVTGETKKLAEDITRPYSNDYDKAKALLIYLNETCTYTLTPDIPPKGVDFVDYFLQTRKGYCTYFASAMTVMSRCVGLPARYVEGFNMSGARLQSNAYTITGRQAHAWCEVYFPAVGWIPFDPKFTSPSTSTHVDYGAEDLPNNPEPTPEPTPKPALEPQQESGPNVLPWVLLWSILAAIIFLPLAWLIVRIVTRSRSRSLSNVQKRFATTNEQCLFYYGEMLMLFSYFHHTVKPGETPYGFAQRVNRWLIVDGSNFSAIAELVVKSAYSGQTIKPEDVKMMADFHKKLAAYTRRAVKPLFYAWHYGAGFPAR